VKVGLYFGSFNPIHTGHLIVASYVANHTDCQQVWLVVSPQNPLKPSSVLLNEYHRLHLVRLAVEDDLRLKASDVEFRLPRPSYTIDTLTYLQEKYPTNEFVVVMGSDSFQNLPRWKNHAQLIRDYAFIIYERPGFPVAEDHDANITVLQAPFLQLSATAIRDHIRSGKSIRYLVPDAVREEIDRNHYYK
jgi:nicotinate-nucleotide adenylyltransferase